MITYHRLSSAHSGGRINPSDADPARHGRRGGSSAGRPGKRRIRTYRTVDGKKIYSSWSKAKTVKIKK